MEDPSPLITTTPVMVSHMDGNKTTAPSTLYSFHIDPEILNGFLNDDDDDDVEANETIVAATAVAAAVATATPTTNNKKHNNNKSISNKYTTSETTNTNSSSVATSISRQSSFRNNSASQDGLLEGFSMREQDADILESLQQQHQSAHIAIPTVLLHSGESTLLLDDSFFARGVISHQKEQDSYRRDDENLRSMSSSTKNNTSTTTTAASILLHHIDQTQLIREESRCGDRLEIPTNLHPPFTPQRQQSFLSRAMNECGPEEINTYISPMKRTNSKERRINEAAQYEEAVGEPAPVCIIDDDDEHDDYFEDDDNDGAITKQQDQQVLYGLTNNNNPIPGKLLSSSSSSSRRIITHASSYSPPSAPLAKSNISTSPTSHQKRGRPRAFSVTDRHHHQHRSSMILTQLPTLATTMDDFVYKGITSNPPDIVKRGTTRGNLAVLHRKAWLEVSDKYHRYGKHLRLYYRHWESIGFPTNQFFDWLDSKGDAVGQPLPEIPECPRSVLDNDTVMYITDPDITEQYALTVGTTSSGRAVFYSTVDGSTVSTGESGWIFVLRDNRWYGAPKVTSPSTVGGSSIIKPQQQQRFHHSSFFGGKAVAAAGIFITDELGRLDKLYPHSGHYRPGEAHMQRVLFYFYHQNVDLRTFSIDTQQIEHVARDGSSTKKKSSKLESLHLYSAITVALFLAHKAKCIRCGLFGSIHSIHHSVNNGS